MRRPPIKVSVSLGEMICLCRCGNLLVRRKPGITVGCIRCGIRWVGGELLPEDGDAIEPGDRDRIQGSTGQGDRS